MPPACTPAPARRLAHSDQRVTPLALDVTSRSQIEAAAQVVDTLDLLINNAGIGLYDDLSDRAALERTSQSTCSAPTT